MLAVQVHESMINNLAEEALSGMILTEERFQEGLENFFDEVPERFQPDEDRPPFTITFASRQPIVVSFHDGEIVITGKMGVWAATTHMSLPEFLGVLRLALTPRMITFLIKSLFRGGFRASAENSK